MEKKWDIKKAAGMIGLIVVLVVIAGAFWTTVIYQSQIEEEEEAVSAIYVETEGPLKLQVFVDMENGTIFTAPVPEAGIYDENNKLVPGDVPENGDMIKLYGDGMMAESFPGQYPGVTKMQRIGRASEKTQEEYVEMVEEALHGVG